LTDAENRIRDQDHVSKTAQQGLCKEISDLKVKIEADAVKEAATLKTHQNDI